MHTLLFGGRSPQLNHRVLLDAMLAAAGVPAAKFRTICSSIDKLDKAEWVRAAAVYACDAGAGAVAVARVVLLLALYPHSALATVECLTCGAREGAAG